VISDLERYFLRTMENAYEKEIAAVSTAMRIGFAKIAYDWYANNIRSIYVEASIRLASKYLSK
jgi:hypothetical protein